MFVVVPANIMSVLILVLNQILYFSSSSLSLPPAVEGGGSQEMVTDVSVYDTTVRLRGGEGGTVCVCRGH